MWRHHYTGIDIYERDVWPGMHLYVHRNSTTERIRFVRLSWKLRKHHMLGVFIGDLNYLPGKGGFELFTNRLRFGYTRSPKWIQTRWSGSMADPYKAVAFKVGCFAIGLDSPKWLIRHKDRQLDRKMGLMGAGMPDADDGPPDE